MSLRCTQLRVAEGAGPPGGTLGHTILTITQSAGGGVFVICSGQHGLEGLETVAITGTSSALNNTLSGTVSASELTATRFILEESFIETSTGGRWD